MDNKGRVTVVLHWDQRTGGLQQSTKHTPDVQGSKYSPTRKPGGDLSGATQRPSLVIQTSLDKLNYGSAGAGGGKPGEFTARYSTTSPQITVINHDDVVHHKSFTSPSIHNNSSYVNSTAGPQYQATNAAAAAAAAQHHHHMPARLVIIIYI